MKKKHERKLYVLYGNNERVFSQYDRNDDYIGGYSDTSIKSEKRLVETSNLTTETVGPDATFPVGIVFDMDLRTESEDGNSSEAGRRNIYAVPIFSYQVVQQLEGRLLDYVDATYAEKDQREAQKRVLRKVLWGYHEELLNARKSAYENSKLVTD